MKACNMPQLSNLVLTDRAATPVNHTFTPLGIEGSVATVVESTGIPIGENKFQISWRNTPAGRRKVTLKGYFPIVQTQTVNGVSTPVVVRSAICDITFSFEGTSSEQERKDVVGMMASALAPSQALVNDAVVKLQAVY